MNRFAPFEQRKDVWLNDIAFSNVDSLGNRWIISDIDGWWDLPAPTIGEVDRPYSEDGSFYEPGRFESRVLRVKGYIQPPNRSQNAANRARQELNKRLQLVRRTGLLKVLESEELGGGKQSEVVIVARPLVSSKKMNGTIDFDVQFRANDPRKYSVVEEKAIAYILNGELGGRTYDLMFNRNYTGTQASNVVVVNNRGDYNTYGVLRFKGPVDNPSATHLETGKTIGFSNLRLGVGQYLEVNLLEKTIITDAGLSIRERMTPESRWFNFDSGINRVSYTGNQYLPPVEVIEDARNLVTNPSFEYFNPNTPRSAVRRNSSYNSSGTLYIDDEIIRDFMAIDLQAQEQSSFATGTVSNGVITGGPVTFKRNSTSDRFPTNGWYPFVQVELNPTTDNTPVATIDVNENTSGPVGLPKDTWTKVRVDGASVASTDFGVKLTIPGVSESNPVKIRNIMILRSPKPLSGATDFSDGAPIIHPDRGTEVFYYEQDKVFREHISYPDKWSIVGDTNAYLYVDDNSTTRIYVPTPGEYTIDLGPSNVAYSRIHYGALPTGNPKKIQLIDDSNGSIIEEYPYENKLFLYEGVEAKTLRIRIVTEYSNEDPDTFEVPGSTFTPDGGTSVFTDKTEPESYYTYSTGNDIYSSLEKVDSFSSLVDSSSSSYNLDSTITNTRSKKGSRGLRIRYTAEGLSRALDTPITGDISGATTRPHYVRASFMATQSGTFELKVVGVTNPASATFTAGPGYWEDVRLEVTLRQGDTPRIIVSPTRMGTSGITLYVDNVGLLTKNIDYFDGSSGDQYRWNGTPNQSTSDTITRVGVPKSQLEIIYRSAWIG